MTCAASTIFWALACSKTSTTSTRSINHKTQQASRNKPWFEPLGFNPLPHEHACVNIFARKTISVSTLLTPGMVTSSSTEEKDVSRHMSCVACHTSRVTRHTSHVTRHTFHVACWMQRIEGHTPRSGLGREAVFSDVVNRWSLECVRWCVAFDV